LNSNFLDPVQIGLVAWNSIHEMLMPRTLSPALVAAWFLVMTFTDVLAASENSQPQPWAIIASPDLQETGFPDLLAVDLAIRGYLDLVERQDVDKVFSEQGFARSLGAESPAPRLKLGKMLGADGLILLSLERNPASKNAARMRPNSAAGTPSQMLRVVLCDCRYGVRLSNELFTFKEHQLDDTCTPCAALIDATRARYRQGIRQIIVVSPFLSKNLLRTHDHLQVAFSTLLETALLGFPGVAVVEIQEAHAIRQELNITATQIRERPVLLNVEGDYELLSGSAHTDPTVSFSVRVSQGNTQQLAVRHEEVKLSKAINLLAESVPQQIASLAQEMKGGGFGQAEQVTMLARRADAFARLASFRESTSFREAALLLAPQDTQLRLTLIAEYLKMQTIKERERNYHSDAEKRSKAEANLRAIGYHTEQLIRSGVLNPSEARVIVGRVILSMRSFLSRCPRPEEPDIAESFFWQVYPLFPTLDATLRDGRTEWFLPGYGHMDQTPRSPLREYNAWASDAIHFSIVRSANHSRGLDQLARFLTTVASPDVPVMRMATLLLTGTYGDLIGMVRDGRLSEHDVRAFYEKLRQTDRPLLVFYARAGLLSLEVNVSRDRKWDNTTLEEVDDLVQILHRLDTGLPTDRTISGYFERYLNRLRDSIKAGMADRPKTKRHSLPVNPIPPIDPKPRIAFKPIDDVVPNWVDLLKCNDRLDVAWSCKSVSAILHDGSINRLFEIPSVVQIGTMVDEIDSVTWDGMYVWIVCSLSGIWIVDPSGTRIAHLDANAGLPPYTALIDCKRRSMPSDSRFSHPRSLQPLALHPIEPGKCLAIGSFGRGSVSSGASQKRTWLAAIHKNYDAEPENSFAIDVFHTITELPGAQSDSNNTSPRQLFDLASLTEYSAPGKHDRLLLLGSRASSLTLSAPLAVNLNSLDVFVFPARIPATFQASVAKPSNDGCIVRVQTAGINLLKPGAERTEDWTREPLDIRASDDPDLLRVELLEFENGIFNPGSKWRRIDRTTSELQVLTRTPVPLRYRFQYYSVSAQWGLVGWNLGDRLFQICLDRDARPVVDELAEMYPEVPSHKRESHNQAVHSIRRLGGSVDTEWAPNGYGRSAPFAWRTVVYLDSTWQGKGPDLGCLSQLHNLTHLYLVGADIRDEGMQSVGTLHELRSLNLVETRVTDDGLRHLANLDQLLILRLEGYAGGLGFSDRGLAHLARLGKLQRITLYGPGFTDDSVPLLQSMNFLQVLELWDTGIGTKGLASIKQHRRQTITILRDGIGL
jgi:hypothetical protein